MLSCVQIQVRTKANKFGYYNHDVRVPYPPKDRSKVWSLPEHKKLVIVTNGHINDHSRKQAFQPPPAIPVTAVVFAKCNTFRIINNVTKPEFEFIITNKDRIRELFDTQASLKEELETKDKACRHICK